MMKNLFFFTSVSLSIVSIVFGVLCVKKPGKIISFQQFFYSKINWRIEPISMTKEIRNTKIMGFFLIFLGIAALALLK